MSTKTNPGNYFEDFRMGQEIRHATPRTVTDGDVALYTALYGPRFAVNSSSEFARVARPAAGAARRSPRVPHRVRQDRAGHLAERRRQPRLRARAASWRAGLSGRHARHHLDGDRPAAEQGRQDRRRLRALGRHQPAAARRCSTICRWVMVRKQDEAAPAPEPVTPDLPEAVDAADLAGARIRCSRTITTPTLAGSPHLLRTTTRSARRSTTSTA